MKLTEQALCQIYCGIEFEKGERAPFFLCDSETVITINEETFNVADAFYTETIDAQMYVKFMSDHKNMDGSFSGAEAMSNYGTPYAQELQAVWQEQLGNPISAETMMEKRRVASMEPLEYREYVREKLEQESKPESFTFTCAPKGVDLEFCIDNEDRVDLLGQMAMGLTEFEVHDVKRINAEPYNQVEVAVIMTTLATVTRMHKYPIDAKIKALYELPEGFSKADVDVILND